ncbi:MAG: hypothetical protein AAFY74_18940 [Pseudomonadota bacterium]
MFDGLLRTSCANVPADNLVDRNAKERQRVRDTENSLIADTGVLAIDRAQIVEFVQISQTRDVNEPLNRSEDGNTQELSVSVDSLLKRDREKLGVLLASCRPDEWTAKVDKSNKEVRDSQRICWRISARWMQLFIRSAQRKVRLWNWLEAT